MAIKLAKILNWYYSQHLHDIEPLISSDIPYNTHVEDLPILEERELGKIVTHLENEMPELKSIVEYPKVSEQWFALSDSKWEKPKPSIKITE